MTALNAELKTKLDKTEIELNALKNRLPSLNEAQETDIELCDGTRVLKKPKVDFLPLQNSSFVTNGFQLYNTAVSSPSSISSNGAGATLNNFDSLDTALVSQNVKHQLCKYHITQRLFALELGVSQATLSVLLNNPDKWIDLNENRRQLFRRMHMISQSETLLLNLRNRVITEQQQQQQSQPNNAQNNTNCDEENAIDTFDELSAHSAKSEN